ncbi:MAG: tetratricopeptide repeat protein [Pirellulales bacterium]
MTKFFSPHCDQLLIRSAHSVWGAISATLLLLAVSGCQFTSNGKNAEGTRYYQQGQYGPALQKFQEARQAQPNNPDSYYNLGATYHQLAKAQNDPSYWQQAENYYNQCLDYDANHVQCYRALAVMLVEQDRSDAAFRLLEGWGDRSPGVADAKVELARLHEEFNDKAAAQEKLLEAIAINTSHPRARAALGRMREEAGDYTQAMNNYAISLQANRLQPEVAARVATLQSSVSTDPLMTTPAGGTRTVTLPANTGRY